MNEIVLWVLLLQLAATLVMVGLIWFVQIVHYPLFARVRREDLVRYEFDHQRLTTWVVAPPMLVELASAIALVWWRPVSVGVEPVWFGLVLLAFIWLMTYRVQVPQHAALATAYDPAILKQLVRGNWFRTIAWTARGLLVLWMVGETILSPTTQSVAGQLADHAVP